MKSPVAVGGMLEGRFPDAFQPGSLLLFLLSLLSSALTGIP